MPVREILNVVSVWILPSVILLILTIALIKKVPLYETFIEGAKDGVKVTFNIVPYLVAIIVAVSMLRASGAIDTVSSAASGILSAIHFPPEILPLAIIRSLSGSGAIGVLSDIVANNDVNSYCAKLAAVMAGSSETTFYVLTVYFGSVGIKKHRYALLTGLCADFIGIVAACVVTYLFFG